MCKAVAHTGWHSHRWSGWPGAYCMLCLCDDPAEGDDTFPYPNDLDNPTVEEDEAMQRWRADKNANTPDCPGNLELVDPYTIDPFKKP